MSFKVADLIPDSRANKYSRGKLVVIAGSKRYPGAAVLAALAGQRMGAGYTEVITAKSAVNLVRMSAPSLVVRPFSCWKASDLPKSTAERPIAVCIGPGFAGSGKEAQLLLDVLSFACCPVLVDGGALGLLTRPEVLAVLQQRLRALRFPSVLTPHGGEAARLARALGQKWDEPAVGAVQLAKALHSTVVLKGPDTHVSDGGASRVITEGTSALAKAGTGDVLAGMIAALLAQGVSPLAAAVAGVVLHARAGTLAASELTAIAVTAEDVIGHIPEALKSDIQENRVVRTAVSRM